MADDQASTEPVALPPKQSPFKTVTLAAPGAAQADPDTSADAPTIQTMTVPSAGEAPTMPTVPTMAAAAPRTVIVRRPTLRRPGEAPKPVTLKPPVPGVPVVQPLSQTTNVAKGIEISHADAAKKVTSRISVSSATAPIPPVAPAAPAAPEAMPLPQTAAPAAPPSEKKITSRITLEAAFSAPSEMPSPIQPRTIKLKRPGAPAIPTPAPAPSPISPISPAAPAAPAAPAVQDAPSLPPGMTPISEAEQPSDPAADETITRRKTIKVKRPGAGIPGAPKLQLGRPDGVATEEDNLQSLSNFGVQFEPQAEPDKANPIFVIAAVLAAVFASLLIWVLASQTYGERGAAGDFARPAGPNVTPPPWLKTFD